MPTAAVRHHTIVHVALTTGYSKGPRNSSEGAPVLCLKWSARRLYFVGSQKQQLHMGISWQLPSNWLWVQQLL